MLEMQFHNQCVHNGFMHDHLEYWWELYIWKLIHAWLSGYLTVFARSSPKTSAISIYGTSPEVHHYYIWSSQVCGKSTANFICMIKSRRKVAANNLLSCKLRRRFTKNLSHAHIWNVARSSPLPYMAISSLPQIYGKFNLHDKKSP